MIQYPEVQRKARAEIDAVVGFDRLPKASDKASLPYIRSLCTEVLRWHPAAPLGKSHYCYYNQLEYRIQVQAFRMYFQRILFAKDSTLLKVLF